MIPLGLILFAFTAIVSWDVIKNDDTPAPDSP
jgi:hypothetical protein